MLFRLICLLAVALPSSLTYAQSGDLPRLNKVEMQIVNMQVAIESQDERIAKNTAAIASLKSEPVGLSAPDPVRKLPPYGVTFSAPVVTYSTPVVVSEPAVTISKPVVTVSKPVATYSRPTVTYSHPVPVVRYTRSVPMTRTRPTLRAKWIGRKSPAGGRCYIDANGNQVCPF